MKSFKTISKNFTAEIEEKKSKFIADIFYITTMEEAELKLREIKKKYFDARHHCYAYRIIDELGEIKEKQSDDGEPSGTAGSPMLNILSKNEIANVLVIITRYFGGTLLGTGGLIRAYSDATLKAIEGAELVLQQIGYEMKVTIEYKDLEKFKYYCDKHGITIINIVYENNIICTIELNEEEKQKIMEKNSNNIKIIEYAVLKRKYIKINKE